MTTFWLSRSFINLFFSKTKLGEEQDNYDTEKYLKWSETRQYVWARKKLPPFAAEMFKCLFLKEHYRIWYEFHRSLFQWFQWTKKAALVQVLLWLLCLASLSTCSKILYIYSFSHTCILFKYIYEENEMGLMNWKKINILFTLRYWTTTLLGPHVENCDP